MPSRRDQPECFPHSDFVPGLAKHDERGVLRQILGACERHEWQVTSVVTERASGGAVATPAAPGDVAVAMTVSGTGILRATGVLATVDGVSSVQQLDDDDTE